GSVRLGACAHRLGPLWECIPSPAEQREMAKPGSWAPSAAPYALHSTIHNILIALFIVESSKHVQRKNPERDGGGGSKQGQPIEAQRTTLPARSTDCSPVIAHVRAPMRGSRKRCVRKRFLPCGCATVTPTSCPNVRSISWPGSPLCSRTACSVSSS